MEWFKSINFLPCSDKLYWFADNIHYRQGCSTSGQYCPCTSTMSAGHGPAPGAVGSSELDREAVAVAAAAGGGGEAAAKVERRPGGVVVGEQDLLAHRPTDPPGPCGPSGTRSVLSGALHEPPADCSRMKIERARPYVNEFMSHGPSSRLETEPFHRLDDVLDPDVHIATLSDEGSLDMELRIKQGRDHWYHRHMQDAASYCPPVYTDSEDPLFILYTSGSTGKPKGVLHTTGGYLLYAAITHKYVFDYHDGDIYWCTADVGWITGHSYIVYGPLANGAIHCSRPKTRSCPSPARCTACRRRRRPSPGVTTTHPVRRSSASGPATSWTSAP